jgi:hypothetical protein
MEVGKKQKNNQRALQEWKELLLEFSVLGDDVSLN